MKGKIHRDRFLLLDNFEPSKTNLHVICTPRPTNSAKNEVILNESDGNDTITTSATISSSTLTSSIGQCSDLLETQKDCTGDRDVDKIESCEDIGRRDNEGLGSVPKDECILSRAVSPRSIGAVKCDFSDRLPQAKP